MTTRLVAFAVLGLALPAQAAPQTYPLTLDHDRLAGAGADVLRAQLASAQFILYGEAHGFADSAIVLRALARDARPLGFKYLVIEVGPISTQLVRETFAHDGLAGIRKMVHQTPLGLPFLALRDDVQLVADFPGSDAKGTPYVWGVDQEFIGSPPLHLQRLLALASNDAARARVRKLLDDERTAAAKADQSKFLLVHGSPEDFDQLAAAFKGNAEAARIIAELKESAAIYQLWMTGHNYENNARRARLLAANFLAGYHAAADPEPKIVFKMGGEHVALGTTTNNTIDLGTLASELARVHGRTALRIEFVPAGGRDVAFAPKPGNPMTIEDVDRKETQRFFRELGIDTATLSTTSWTLIPIEPIRQALDTKGLGKLSAEARLTVLGFDYLITTADAKPGESLY